MLPWIMLRYVGWGKLFSNLKPSLQCTELVTPGWVVKQLNDAKVETIADVRAVLESGVLSLRLVVEPPPETS